MRRYLSVGSVVILMVVAVVLFLMLFVFPQSAHGI